MLTWKRTAADSTEASAQSSRDSLKIGNLLDHPGLRLAMGLDREQTSADAPAARTAIDRKRRFDLRRLLESATV